MGIAKHEFPGAQVVNLYEPLLSQFPVKPLMHAIESAVQLEEGVREEKSLLYPFAMARFEEKVAASMVLAGGIEEMTVGTVATDAMLTGGAVLEKLVEVELDRGGAELVGMTIVRTVLTPESSVLMEVLETGIAVFVSVTGDTMLDAIGVVAGTVTLTMTGNGREDTELKVELGPRTSVELDVELAVETNVAAAVEPNVEVVPRNDIEFEAELGPKTGVEPDVVLAPGNDIELEAEIAPEGAVELDAMLASGIDV
jgi:hypothetical protein